MIFALNAACPARLKNQVRHTELCLIELNIYTTEHLPLRMQHISWPEMHDEENKQHMLGRTPIPA